MRIRALLIFFVAIFLFGIPGCDLSSDRTAAPSADPTSTVLRRGNGGDPGTLDPALAEDIHSFNVLIDLYEGLVAAAADGALIPGVAESWHISDNGLVYTFDLRADARWSNGDPVIATDFVNAFRRVASPSTNSALGFLLEPLRDFGEVKSGIKADDELGVSAIDDHTLMLRLSAPSAHFLGVLAMPIAYPMHGENFSQSQFRIVKEFIGNGAYVLSDRQANGPIRLRRNNKYWDSQSVSIDAIEYLPVVDSVSELNMYRAGDLDISMTIPPSHFSAFRESAPEEVRVSPALALYYLAFDLTEPPLNSRPLRKALSMAIDREQLVRLIGRGETAAFGLVPPGIANHIRARYDWQNLQQAERESRAKASYNDAGYDSENPLAIKLTYDVGDLHEHIALIVSSMWTDVLGIDVELEKLEWKYFLDTRSNRSNWQIMRFSWVGDFNDPATFAEIFRSGSPQNLPHYVNSLYDNTLDRASVAVNPDTRLALMTRAEEVLNDDYPIAPLYFYVNKHLVKPYVRGFEDNLLDRHPSRFLKIEISH